MSTSHSNVILISDDEETARLVSSVAKQIEKPSLSFTWVRSFVSDFSAYQAHQHNIVLLDPLVLNEGWIQTFRKRDLKSCGMPVPIIGLLHSSGNEEELNLIRVGAFDFLKLNSLCPLRLANGLHRAIRRSNRLAAIDTSNICFKRAFDQSLLGMALVGVDGTIIRSNPALVKMLGYSTAAELYKIECREITHPADYRKTLLQVQHLINGGEATFTLEKRYIKKSGEIFWAEVSVSLIRDAEKIPLYYIVQYKDITEQRRKAEELIRSEQLYRVLIETANHLTWTVDTEGRWTYLNRAATKQIYGREPEEMLGRQFSEFTAADRIEIDLQTFASIKVGTPVYSYHTRHLRKDGSTVELSFNAAPIYDEHGHIQGTTGTAVDITESVRVTEELKEQKEFFRQVIDLNPSFIFAKDREGRFTLANEALAKAYGTSPENLIGKTDADFNVNSAEVEHFREDDLEVMDMLQEKFIPEEAITDATGRVRWLQTVKRPLRNERGLVEQVLGVATDISLRRRAEFELRDLAQVISSGTGEALYVALVKYVVDTFGLRAAFIGELTEYDELFIRTRALCLNGEICPNISYRLKGSPSEKVIGREFCFFPDKVAEMFPSCRLLNKWSIRGYAGFPLFHSDGRPLGVVVILDNKPLAELEHLRYVLEIIASRVAAELERSMLEQERQIVEAQFQHSQKLESLGILAGGIAHDFNNLLVGVLGNAGLALMDLPPESPACKRVENIRTAAERAAELTNQLLAYSGKGKFQVKRVDLSELVCEMGDLLSTVISKHAKLTFDCSDAFADVEGDATQLRQVVMNLITNASDALGKGEGEITVRVDDIDIDRDELTFDYFTDAEIDTGTVMLEVRDNGEGMEEATLRRMFEPFFSTKFTGKGLGLAAVLGIVKSHRGGIAVSSTKGKGTTFRVFLPTKVGLTTFAPRVLTRPLDIGVGCGTVLVVDDEPAVRQVAEAILRHGGYGVLVAGDGASAISMFEEHAEDVRAVLLDLTMPRMGGKEVGIQMQQLRPGTPIIFSSGYSQQELEEDALLGSTMTFIQKPYNAQDLLKKLKTCIS